MKKAFFYAAFLFSLLFHISSSQCIETANPFDDFLSVPSPINRNEPSFNFPGSESFGKGPFCNFGWFVPYAMDELSISALSVGWRFGRGGLSLSWNGCGFDLYGEEQEKIGISLAPLRSLSLGLKAGRTGIRIKNFGRDDIFSLDCGFLARYSEILYIAGALENISDIRSEKNDTKLERTGRFSAVIEITKETVLIAAFSKTGDYALSKGVGFSTKIGNIMDIGIIGADNPDRLEFLCGLIFKKMKISWKGSYHRELGLSQGCSISSVINAE